MATFTKPVGPIASLLFFIASVGASGDEPAAAVPIAGERQFALEMHSRLAAKSKGNVVASPYGLYEIVGLLSAGASGATQAGFQQTLGTDASTEELAAELRRLRVSCLPLRYQFPALLQDNNRYGVVVTGFPAGEAGADKPRLQKGDLIFTIDGQVVRTVIDVDRVLADARSEVSIEGYRFQSGEPFRDSVSLPSVRDTEADSRNRPIVLASGLWVQKIERVRPAFQSLVANQFGAHLFNTDFRNPDTIATQVDDYFHRQLKGRISRFYSIPQLPPSAELLAVNLMSMDVRWGQPFSESASGPGEFTTPEGPINVRYMKQTEWFPYYEHEAYQAIELPYEKSTLSMLIVLPRSPEQLPAIEHTILGGDGNHLTRLIQALAEKEVAIELPAFRLSQHGSLRAALSEMGLAEAFGPRADFSRLVQGRSIRLDEVAQQTTIEVNEAGTQATSATDAVGVALSASNGVPFHARHPFVFLIHDQNGGIFFTGRVTRPSEYRAKTPQN